MIVVVLASRKRSLTFVYVHLALPLFLSLTHFPIMENLVSEDTAPGPRAPKRQELGDQAQLREALDQM